jgi:branched-chain amino acid transport system substrate-binding protein
MSRPRKAAIVSIVLLGAALLAAPSPAAAQGPSGRDPVRIGVAGPISGGSAAFGLQFKEGVEQAVADINAGGGILGRELTLVIGDDRGDPKDGMAVANRFVGDGVKFVIGHFNSGVTSRASTTSSTSGRRTPAAS